MLRESHDWQAPPHDPNGRRCHQQVSPLPPLTCNEADSTEVHWELEREHGDLSYYRRNGEPSAKLLAWQVSEWREPGRSLNGGKREWGHEGCGPSLAGH